MKEANKIMNLEQLLERLRRAAGAGDRVAVRNMIEVLGQKSFGPLLIFGGMIAFSPLSAIPGVPTTIAVFILLSVTQLLFGKKSLWLPKWVLNRTVSRDKFLKGLKWLIRPARLVDRIFRPRLTVLTGRVGSRVIAVVCVLIALAIPALELVPMSATTAGAALTAFGLSLTAHDGVMALVAFIVTAAGATFIGRALL